MKTPLELFKEIFSLNEDAIEGETFDYYDMERFARSYHLEMLEGGIGLIQKERMRQINIEGCDNVHDDKQSADELAIAGAMYALPVRHRDVAGSGSVPRLWPWGNTWWKPVPADRIRELTKAGALIAAEIDRLTRLKK